LIVARRPAIGVDVVCRGMTMAVQLRLAVNQYATAEHGNFVTGIFRIGFFEMELK